MDYEVKTLNASDIIEIMTLSKSYLEKVEISIVSDIELNKFPEVIIQNVSDIAPELNPIWKLTPKIPEHVQEFVDFVLKLLKICFIVYGASKIKEPNIIMNFIKNEQKIIIQNSDNSSSEEIHYHFGD